MKKFFISLLIGLMVGGCFVGCGEKDDKVTPPEYNNKIEDILNNKDKDEKDDKDIDDEKDKEEKDDEDKEEKQTYSFSPEKAISTTEKLLKSYNFDYYEVDYLEDFPEYGIDGHVLAIYIEQDGAPIDGMLEDYSDNDFEDFDMDEFEELIGIDEIKSDSKKLYKEVINKIEDKYGEEINVIIAYANEESTPIYMVTSEGEEIYNICDFIDEYMYDYDDDYEDEDEYYEDEYYDDIDYEILEPAADYILEWYLGRGSVTYNRGSNQLICRVTFGNLEMENDYGIPDCTKEDFEEFMIEEGLVDEAYGLAYSAQEAVRNEFDPRLEVVVEVYYSDYLMIRVYGDEGVSGL